MPPEISVLLVFAALGTVLFFLRTSKAAPVGFYGPGSDAIGVAYQAYLQRIAREEEELLKLSAPELFDWWLDYGCAEVAGKYPHLKHARGIVERELYRHGFTELPTRMLTEEELEAGTSWLRAELFKAFRLAVFDRRSFDDIR
jgi:hypothetical protein